MAVNSKAILKSAALFAALNEAELESLALRVKPRSFAPGEALFSEGESCHGLYIVVAGRVRIFKTSVSGREQVLAVEGPGSSIAELPVFDGGTYPASASAMERAEALFISRVDLRTLCMEHPEVALKMLQVAGSRLRRLVGIIEELSFATVRHRLISWILRQAKSAGRSTERGIAITLDSSHQELAAHIGTVRELVSRNLIRLQAQNLIEMNGRDITLTDQEGLEAELASVV